MDGDGGVDLELLAWLREEIDRCEERLSMLRRILALVERDGGDADPLATRPGETLEIVKNGKRRIARLFRGEDYVRLAPVERLALPREAREYLETVVEEIRGEQARRGEARAELKLREDPVRGVIEILITGLDATLHMLKAKAALKHTAEVAWQYTKARRRKERDHGLNGG
jgi:hypothetical protein